MVDRFRIYLTGFRAGAHMEELDRYLQQILHIADEKSRKRLVFDTPSLLSEVEDEDLAVAIRSELEAIGVKTELKRIVLPADLPPVVTQPIEQTQDEQASSDQAPDIAPRPESLFPQDY